MGVFFLFDSGFGRVVTRKGGVVARAVFCFPAEPDGAGDVLFAGQVEADYAAIPPGAAKAERAVSRLSLLHI